MRVDIKPNTYLYLVILLFLLPIEWLLAWLMAMVVHEFSHWLGVKLCGGKVLELSASIGGIQMQSTPLTDRKRLFSILSGPFGGLLLASLGRWFPRMALCSWVLSVYNLLPLLFLDGGKALEIIAGASVATVTEKIILVLLSFLAIYVSVLLGFGILPVAVIVGLWLKSRKSPCKQSICKLQ